MKVRRKSDGHVLGGWAAEYKGHGTEQLVKKILHEDLDGMFKRSVHLPLLMPVAKLFNASLKSCPF